MTCAKQRVVATIVTPDGFTYVGENLCENPQTVCPRDAAGYKTGEGYELCKSICNQGSHAEVAAINLAGDACSGSTLYLTGHTYACDSCKSAAFGAGISSIVIT